MQLEGLNFAPWRRRSSITELRLCAFVASCQETTLLNQLTKLFLTGSLIKQCHVILASHSIKNHKLRE